MEGFPVASLSNALVRIKVDGSDTQDTEVARRHGAGLTMFQFSTLAARPIRWVADRLAADPTRYKSLIEEFFGDNDHRQKALDELYYNQNGFSSRCKSLQRYCDLLLQLARSRSTTVDTQLIAFKVLVTVITRYPGIRRMFQTHKDLKKASAKDLLFNSLWTRPDQSCGDEWNFYRGFAVFCISETALTRLMEAEPPSMLSRVDLDGTLNNVPIEELLGHAKDGPHFEPPRICAIQYLAGVFELPNFWKRFPPHNSLDCNRPSDVLSALCDTIHLLLDDTTDNAGALSVDLSPSRLAAQMAVDLLACSMLNGLVRLRDLQNLPQCPNKLPEIIATLLRHNIKENFPRASKPASEIRDILGTDSSLFSSNTRDEETLPEIAVLEQQRQLLGDDHPYTLHAMANLAAKYQELGRYPEAEAQEVVLIQKWKQLLGTDHPDTLHAMANLACTYSELGLGTDHPDTLHAMANLARIYSELGLGTDHPDTLPAMANLARTYSKLGRYQDAEALRVTLLKKWRLLFGPEHLGTLHVMANLAHTYSELGRYQEAETLEATILEIQKISLGANHPDTLAALENLVATYHKLGKYQEAKELLAQ
ncbi:hypothetical protein B0H14DRAFT_2463894 [Mycena olivaceomarginata]|nr:hypothetical protein B0H14DRAFT_2463894 [Mycena olivaceomarginata]